MTNPHGGQVLVVEDEEGNRNAMRRVLETARKQVQDFPEVRVYAFGNVDDALEHIRRNDDVLVVVTDLRMPDKDGFCLMREARQIDPGIGILMVTAYGSIDLAVDAMKQGADDFLTKPVDPSELRMRVSAILERRQLEREVRELRRRMGEFQGFGNLVGKSPEMQRLYRQLEMIAPTRSTVLIIGDSGTGKELVANAIHENSPRRAERFLPINCGAIPAEILESELFGHERGSFTGASARKMGKFEVADKGTLFLDEVSELPLDMQVKLLRVLEEQEFMRVGGTESVRVDVRILAATNSDLERAVAEGRFRSDLYYRLKVLTVRLPSLRERKEDIPLLTQYFLDRFCAENERPTLAMTSAAMRILVENPWEGNVRELRNLLESLVVFAAGDTVDVADLPREYVERTSAATGAPVPSAAAAIPEPEGAVASMEEIERRAILRALTETGGNRTQAADRLGIGLRTLQRKLKEYRARGLYQD